MQPLLQRISSVLLVLLAILCFSTQATAQKKNKRTKVVVENETKPFRFDTVRAVKNAFKMNPLIFLTGEIPLYYERALSPQISVEAAIGITLRNYISLSFNEDTDDFGGGIEILTKPSFHFAFRYYFDDNVELAGLYLSPEFSYRNYSKYVTEKDDDGGFTDQKLLDERIYNDIKLVLGYQVLSHSSNWVVDMYTGLGARVRSLSIVKEQNTLGNGFNYEVEEKSDIVPAFYLGFKLGYGF